AGSVVFQEAAPVILVNTGQSALPAAAYQAMQAAQIQQVVILGGPAAVSPALQQAMAQALPTVAIQRYGGATRNATAAAFDQAYFGPSPGGAVLAANGGGGGSFVDALAAAPLAGVNGVPILLTNPTALPASTAGYLTGMAANQPIWVMGGSAAIADQVLAGLSSSSSSLAASNASGG
ncbi:MAG: cell wall-binding repeat-containing protein, partial [Firmicutes bacterium]|nr:cell wall-binding repeat-containing protein [Bacillota bacterium]